MALCLPVVSSSPAPDGLLQPIDGSSLFVLQSSADPSLVWVEYQRFLLSHSRVTPLLLYFTTSRNDHDVSSTGQNACSSDVKLVEAVMELAADNLSTPQLPIVRVDVQSWPMMLRYHLISTAPSLLWIPGRVSGRFQRYPHVETNFLDLSANGSLFTFFGGEKNDGSEDFTQSKVLRASAAEEIVAFVRLCQERSGYLTRNARGRLSPTGPISPGYNSFSGLELIPILGFLAFIAFVINENRELVVRIVRTRLFWFVLCLGVIYVALSGLFYSIIHRPVWYYFGRVHGFVFVYPSSRRQFVLEGLVNGAWSFWLSLGMMSISDLVPALKSSRARDDVIRWSLLLVVVSYMALYLTFLMKYRWLTQY
ncbi:putative membrane protein [Phytophthora megakarya]|uniref:Putative membrane protein n=1 Tax=Phytophthora megakarya TaxID=4795 RepID=A0A225W195_9STRA|nr:putative membrane protein [Phytophthora megakarya]